MRLMSNGRMQTSPRCARMRACCVPADLDFTGIAGLSSEVRQKLMRHRPATIAQAARIDGMTPAALMLLLAHIKKAPRRGAA